MLENIKSKYILKIIFYFIEEKKKLKVIKYNKYLQNKFDIKIIDYRLLSQKYIIYEDNFRGKEYNIYGHLIYEGEYLNGERNGKGKEYRYNTIDKITFIKFEGEYLNGKRNGKGKDLSIEGKILFEGEYLNGCKWNGKIYDIKNNNIYEIKNGCGYYKEFNYNCKLILEGEYINGKVNEKVKEYHEFGKIIKWKKKWTRKRIFLLLLEIKI